MHIYIFIYIYSLTSYPLPFRFAVMKGGDDLDEIFKDVKEALGPLDDQSEKSGADRRHEHVQNTTFPTEMNCSQVFDQLLKCYSIGGQIRNYYRYGEINYCHDTRSKLKFCLGVKLKGEEDRKEEIRKWYMKQLGEQQAKHHSSETVWSSREVPLRMPFREDSAKYLGNQGN